jgi:hypothetical protein
VVFPNVSALRLRNTVTVPLGSYVLAGVMPAGPESDRNALFLVRVELAGEPPAPGPAGDPADKVVMRRYDLRALSCTQTDFMGPILGPAPRVFANVDGPAAPESGQDLCDAGGALNPDREGPRAAFRRRGSRVQLAASLHLGAPRQVQAALLGAYPGRQGPVGPEHHHAGQGGSRRGEVTWPICSVPAGWCILILGLRDWRRAQRAAWDEEEPPRNSG